MAKVQNVKIVGLGKNLHGSGAYPTSSPSQSSKERDYQAEDDHRTLTRADEVRQDPARMRGARKHARGIVRTASRLYGRSTSR